MMRRPWRPWALLAPLAMLCVCGAGPVDANADRSLSATPPASQTATAREILVMLRLTPGHLRPNGSYGGDYGDHLGSNARHRIAERIARRYALSLVEDGWPMPVLGIDCYVMRVPDGMTPQQAAEQVSRDPQVAWSQPMQVFQAEGGEESDPLYAAQPAAAAWRLADLHRVATGRGVLIAVIDSKVEYAHPDLAGQVIANRDFIGNGRTPAERHGTAVAGIIGARSDNGIGISGIAPGARMIALRACWQTGAATGAPTLCNSLSLAKAIHYAIERRVQVINLSLAGPRDELIGQLLDQATAHRIAVVAAYDPNLPGGGFPASLPGVLAVANESLPALPAGVYAAPGQDVPTTQPGGKWYLVSGSSYSAAHISGLIALVREGHAAPSSTLLVAAGPHGGIVDACATLLRASKGCNCRCPAPVETARAGP